MKTLVYFGSAFNPPHLGHMQCLMYLAARPGVAKVLAGPSYAHAFGKEMAPYEARIALTKEMISLHSVDAEVSTIEADIAKPNSPVYTYDVLAALKKRFPTYNVAFAMGLDNAENFHKFYKNQAIKKEYPILIIPDMAPVRSTQLRAAAKSNNCEEIAQYTHPSLVQSLVNLYR